jgi:hypothetical protein
LKVFDFGLQQAGAEVGAFRVAAEKFDKAGLGELEKLFALPKGVIGIQSDCR